MNLNQLRYFMKVADSGSITAAAQQLYISQPSLSKAIAMLETEYGIQLLNRTPNGVTLTAQGVEFLNGAKSVLLAANALDNTFSDRGAGKRAQLFVAAQQCDFLYDLLIKTFDQFKIKAIFSNVVETDRSHVVRMVLDRDVDIGIIVRTSSDSKTFLWHTEARRLDIHLLDRAGVFACVGPKSAYYERESITFSEAEQCPQIALDMEEEAKLAYFLDRSQSHFNPNNLIFFNSICACERFLLETDALLYIAKWAIGCFSKTQIRAIPVVPELMGETIPVTELLWLKRAGESLNAIETLFIEHLNHIFTKPDERK